MANKTDPAPDESDDLIPQINLVFDVEHFPQLTSRYSMTQLRDVLFDMCKAQKLPITETSLYSCAATLESDLESMFPRREG